MDTVDAIEGDRGCLPAFVGREADMQELRQAWRRVVGGGHHVVLLAGEPGIGKTTLVERLAREVVADGGRVLWGTCPADPSTPYAPVAQILAGAASSAPADVVSRHAVLAHLAPALRERAAGVPPLPQDRRQLFHAAAELIAELAVQAPLMLVVDDLHRAHRTTVRLLQYVLATTSDVPMLVIGTYCDTSVDRAHAVSSLLADLAHDGDAVHTMLDGLPREAVNGILPAKAVVDAIWLRAEGNPLFLAELLRHVGTGLPTVDPRTLPQSVETGVGRRLARMDAGTRQLLAVAAIIGPEFSLDTVARTGEVPPSRLLAAAEEAVREDIVEPTGVPNQYRFTHDVVRSAVEHLVAANRGVHVHGRLAADLEHHPAAPPVVVGGPVTNGPATNGHGGDDRLVRLAFHAAASCPVGGSVSAAAHAGRAGDQAMAVLAFDEAAGWYGVGMGLLGGHGREAARLKCRLLVSLGEAHDRAGEKVRARHSFLEADAIARTIQDQTLITLAAGALSGSPWPVTHDKAAISRIPVGIQNQHPFVMPEAPPATLLPLGALLAAEADPSPKPTRPGHRAKAKLAAKTSAPTAPTLAAPAAADLSTLVDQGRTTAPTGTVGATAPTARKSPVASPKPPVAAKPKLAPKPTPAPTSARRPARRKSAAIPVEEPMPTRPEPSTPDDLRELWAEPDPETTAMGWTEAPWDDDDPTPASRRSKGRLAALRARHSRPWGPEDLEERLHASEQIVAIATATDDADLAMEGYAWRIADRLEMGRLAQADEDISAFSGLAGVIGDPLYRRDAAAYSVMRAMLEGRFDDARSARLDVRALAQRAGDTKDSQADRDQRYWMALEWGSDEAVAEIEDSLKALPLGRAWGATVALLLARTRRYDAAQEWLNSISEHVLSTRPFDAEWMQMAACAVEAGALVRDSRVAVVVGPLLQPYAERVVVLSGGMVCLGSTARFAGLAAATCGDWPLAERNFDMAVTANRKLEAYPALAHTQAAWGWALLAQGRRADRSRAERLLGQARDLADELDMRRLAADIRVRRGGR